MKRYLQTIALLVLTLSLQTEAVGQEIRTLFRSIPIQVLPHFSAEHKEALLQAYDKCQSNSLPTDSLPVTNNYGASSYIIALAEDFMYLQLDDEVTLQVKRLHTDQDKVLNSFVFTSLVAPNISVLVFYDDAWQQLPTDHYFQRPENRDFIQNIEKRDKNYIKARLNQTGPFALKYQWLQDEPVLLVENASFQMEQMKKLYPELAKELSQAPLRYKWTNGKLIRE